MESRDSGLGIRDSLERRGSAPASWAPDMLWTSNRSARQGLAEPGFDESRIPNPESRL
jgi:hypothetical protein